MFDNARSVGKRSDRAFGGGLKNFFIGRMRMRGEVVGRLEGVKRMCMGVGGGGFGASGVREGVRRVGVHWSLGCSQGWRRCEEIWGEWWEGVLEVGFGWGSDILVCNGVKRGV